MGSTTSAPSEEIKYIQTINDPHFGDIDIYRTSNMTHIMSKTFNFMERDKHFETLTHYLKFMHQTRHSSLVPVHKLLHTEGILFIT